VTVPFGLHSAPFTFQRTMSQLFQHLPFVLCFLDDILIYSTSMHEHVAHMDAVIKILHDANLTLNWSKCQFARDEITYLGFSISAQGLKPSPDNLNALARWSKPKSVKDVRSLLGSLNFFRHLVPNFSKKVEEITDLTKQTSNSRIEWTASHSATIDDIILSLSSSRLSYPLLGEPFDIYTDASDKAIGAAVFQRGKPIYFYSKKLAPAETRYTVSEKEALAIVCVLKDLRHLLLSSPLTIYTDHTNLLFLSTSDLQRIQRWRILMDEFSITVIHIPGKDNAPSLIISPDTSTRTQRNPRNLLSRSRQRHSCWIPASSRTPKTPTQHSRPATR
jgi:hypothetical protein